MDIKEVKRFYKQHLERYGDDLKGLGWFNPEEVPVRFEVTSSIADLNNSSILDVGSGFGGLYNYLVISGIKNFSYLGIDIMAEIVDIAKKRNPKATFEVKDILKEDIEKFDYVFCIGALNITADNYGEYVRQMIMKMLSIARKGVALNFLSDKKYLQAGPYHFEDPKELKEFIEKNTDARAEIIEDERVKGESFLYIRKN